MNSQDSWIDSDEIKQLVSSINSKDKKCSETASNLKGFGTPLFDFSGEGDDDEKTTPIPPEDNRFEHMDSEAPEIPLPSEENKSQKPQVQALAEAKTRAGRGGLLKNKKAESPLWPAITPLVGTTESDVKVDLDEIAEEAAPSEEDLKEESQRIELTEDKGVEDFELTEEDGVEDLELTEDEVVKALELSEDKADEEIASPPETPEKPDSLRKRLSQFADQTLSNFDATGISITDFAGYRVFQRGSADSLAHADATSLLTDQINRLSEAVGAPELGSTQISLGQDRWLCVVEAESATGGVLAQLQIPEPLNSGSTSQFRSELEMVLRGN